MHRVKMEQVFLAYGHPKESVTTIMMLYKNTKEMIHTTKDDTKFIDNVAGNLPGGTLAPFQFIICINYVQRTLEERKENDFALKKIQEVDGISQKLKYTCPSQNYAI